MVVPRIERPSRSSLELADFAHAIRTGAEPRSTPALGLEVVRALEAAHQSLAQAGEPVALGRAGAINGADAGWSGSNGNGAHGNGNGAHANGAPALVTRAAGRRRLAG